MGLKRFNLDVKDAATDPSHGVSSIKKGDSEGEIVFTYAPEGRVPIELQVLATDVDSYPKGSSFLIFTSSDHVEEDLLQYLQGVAERASGKNIVEVIVLLSTKLAAKLSSISHESDDVSGEDEIECDSGFDDTDFTESEEDYDIELDPVPARALAPNHPLVDSQESLKRFKRHLRQASAAGLFVFFLTVNLKTLTSGIFSMAIRVSKLNIPEEALEAWDLKSSDYIVLLVRLPYGYPANSDILELPSEQSVLQFRFGKCDGPQPSMNSVHAAFDLDGTDHYPENSQPLEDRNSTSYINSFVPLLMSKSLNLLLNQEFLNLLTIRRQQNVSWDQAQSCHFNRKKGDHRRTQSREVEIINENPEESTEKQTNDVPGDLKWLPHDYALDDDLNIFLVAMQFGLERLTRCTKYCMVCHRKTDHTFQAVKPYVCDNSLCLYQYMALGFGHSIEHEIINNPYVVDLLISFFNAAVLEKRLREFPSGLNLKYAHTGSVQEPAEHLLVDVCFATKTIKFGMDDYISYNKITEGSFVLLVITSMESYPNYSIMTGGLERHSCIIESAGVNAFTFRIVSTMTGPPNVELQNDANMKSQATCPSKDWMKVMLFKHDKDVDELEETDRNIALMLMTHNIPSVLEMKDYLLAQPGRLLSSWKRMDTSTLALLRWIVASNRSFIVQDTAVPDFTPTLEGSASKPRNRVIGLGEEWLQFRFVQGSPEKEQEFCHELDKNGYTNNVKKRFPSLFAWHGSPLGNWHSIIRTGLDFSTSIHGRAYGNGVYLSPDFTVSSGYIGHGFSVRNSLGNYINTWPNSQLQVGAAISLCEVVNEPLEYVSTSPHYVVDKVEWIQCRYLFASVCPKDLTKSQLFPKPLVQETGYLEQAPGRELLGPDSKEIQIPSSAISTRRRLARGMMVPRTEDTTGTSSQVDICEDKCDDVDMFLGPEEDNGPDCTVRQRRCFSEDSGMEETRPPKLTTTMQEARNACPVPKTSPSGSAIMTTFQPGSLDLDSLPKLLEPTWASSSPAALRSINREIKELQRIQTSSDIHMLGWYIDFDKLSNLFHWIVELHSFDESLPLAKDMKRADCTSIVLEFRFGASFPMSPPFVRVVRPRFLPFAQGGGGHVTAGGAICSELLTNSGWSPALSLEKVLLEVRMNLCDMDPPARLDSNAFGLNSDYGIGEAVAAFRRAVAGHGWQLPSDISSVASAVWLP